MTGKLYVIGVGPGDPELLTFKAVRILKKVSCICVPKGKEDGSSLALSIIKKALNLDNKEIIEAHFPMRKTKERWGNGVAKKTNTPTLQHSNTSDCELDMKWNETVENILNRLNKGMDVAFITLGDPTIYSTFFYLYDRLFELTPELNMEIIPGVSSINAASSRAKISLGLADERIAILPANYPDNLKETLERFDTVVLMKVHKAFDNVLQTLNEMNFQDNAVYISKAGMEDEKIFRNILDVKKEDLNYFSMMIIRK